MRLQQRVQYSVCIDGFNQKNEKFAMIRKDIQVSVDGLTKNSQGLGQITYT